MSNFDIAIVTVLGHEGGYSNNSKDPGGATDFGISLRYLQSIGQLGDINGDGLVDAADIRDLTEDKAKEIYKRDWWDKHGYSRIKHQSIATKLFDLAVNVGSNQAHKIIQRAVWASDGDCTLIKDDGILGEKSIAAINGYFPTHLLVAMRSEAAGFYRSLNKPEFINGWLRRAYN